MPGCREAVRHGETGPLVACVTGASGMIGSRIVTRLADAGGEVRVLTRRPWRGDPHAIVHEGDLLDPAVLGGFLDGASRVFHCAAELHERSRMWRTNVDGTAGLFSMAAASGVDVFCLMSSVGVIGRTTQIDVTEETPCDPTNDYERSKLAAEQIVARAGGKARIVILRPTNVVAPERPGAVGIAMRASALDRLKIFVQGREFMHIVHADNVAAAAVHAAAGPATTYIVSSDDDSRNTLAGLWTLAHGTTPPTLPLVIPHLARRMLRGRGNRGDVRYSSARLRASGFMFPLGFEDTVTDILRARGRLL